MALKSRSTIQLTAIINSFLLILHDLNLIYRVSSSACSSFVRLSKFYLTISFEDAMFKVDIFS